MKETPFLRNRYTVIDLEKSSNGLLRHVFQTADTLAEAIRLCEENKNRGIYIPKVWGIKDKLTGKELTIEDAIAELHRLEKMENSDHHKAPKVFLGDSDSARLLLVYDPSEGVAPIAKNIFFSEDGCYSAYITSPGYNVPVHYSAVFSAPVSRARFFDDNRKTFEIDLPCILTIYRAGDFGCIFNVSPIED